jgi:hypothetical protein
MQITTPGQVQAGALTRLHLTTPTAGWMLTSMGLDPGAHPPTPLLQTAPQDWHGVFRAALTSPATLQVHLRFTRGDELVLSHPYRLRQPGDGIRVGGGTTLPGRSTASIGLDDTALLELSENGGAGLLVVSDGFGSVAGIDSRHIVFSDNTGGDMVGNVVDGAP